MEKKGGDIFTKNRSLDKPRNKEVLFGHQKKRQKRVIKKIAKIHAVNPIRKKDEEQEQKKNQVPTLFTQKIY